MRDQRGGAEAALLRLEVKPSAALPDLGGAAHPPAVSVRGDGLAPNGAADVRQLRVEQRDLRSSEALLVVRIVVYHRRAALRSKGRRRRKLYVRGTEVLKVNRCFYPHSWSARFQRADRPFIQSPHQPAPSTPVDDFEVAA